MSNYNFSSDLSHLKRNYSEILHLKQISRWIKINLSPLPACGYFNFSLNHSISIIYKFIFILTNYKLIDVFLPGNQKIRPD